MSNPVPEAFTYEPNLTDVALRTEAGLAGMRSLLGGQLDRLSDLFQFLERVEPAIPRMGSPAAAPTAGTAEGEETACP